MKTAKVAAVVLCLAALGMAAPLTVMADEHAQEPGPRTTIVTIVCTIYADHMDESIAGMDLVLGLSLGQLVSDCEMTAEYVEAAAPPTASVMVAEGSLFPTCVDTDDCFNPNTITVEPGTALTWTNHDSVLHTVTETKPDPAFDEWVSPGEGFTFTFDTPGTYIYGCTIHPWANGTVIVSEAVKTISEDAVEPAAVTEEVASNEELVFELVDEFIALYMEEGEDAFETITGMSSDSDPVVGFVVNVEAEAIVAHSSAPGYVGLNVAPILDKASIPLEVMLQIVEEEEDGVWLSYPTADLQGNPTGYDRGWMKLHDGHIFVGRYSVDVEDRVQSIVEEIIRLYRWNSEDAFDTINSFMSQSPSYPFVIDLDTQTIAAHGSNPDRVGGASVILTNSTITLEEVLSMEEGDGAWAEYVILNPETGTDQAKRSWVVVHDGHLFGSGYHP